MRPTSGTLAALLATATITACSRPAAPVGSSSADARTVDPAASRPVRARIVPRPDEPDDDIHPCPGPSGADVADDLQVTPGVEAEPGGVAAAAKTVRRGPLEQGLTGRPAPAAAH